MRKIMVLMVLAACAPSKEEEAREVAKFENDANMKVALDLLREHEIVLKRGDKMEICAHTGMLAAAFLQMKDEEKYNAWKDLEKTACKRAGL